MNAPTLDSVAVSTTPVYTVEQFRADLQEPYVWPGGYPRYFLCSDGEALSYAAAQECAPLIEQAIEHRDTSGGWRVVACEVNWEDPELYCSHTNKRIESAYAEDDAPENQKDPKEQ